MKLKIFFLFCGLWLSILHANGQAPEWSRLLQTSSYGNPILSCISGDEEYVVTAGAFSGPLNFDGASMVSEGRREMFVSMSLTSGETLWLKHFTSTENIVPSAIKMDQSGNVFLTGGYSGTANVEGTTLSGTNGYMASLDIYGEVRWVVPLADASSGTSRIEIDSDGNSYLASNMTKLQKFSPDGTILWEQGFPQGTLRTLSIHGDRLYLGGILPVGTTTIGPFIFTKSFKTGILLKANLDGEYYDFLEVEGTNANSNGSAVTTIKTTPTGTWFLTGDITETWNSGGPPGSRTPMLSTLFWPSAIPPSTLCGRNPEKRFLIPMYSTFQYSSTTT